MNPLFEGVQANDAKDLINFILQELHEELNNAKINPIENQENMIFNVNQYDENQMFLNFIEEFKKNQKSIISDIFYFIIETKTECLNCRKINRMRGINNPVYLYNFQIMNFLIFPLEEIRKYKINICQQNFQEVDLIDCFIYYQKVDYMQGENQMWCSNCNQNAPSQYMTSLYSSPVYLVLILNRGKGNIYNVKLNFSEILNIGNFVYMKKSNDLIYHLYAIVTHIGPSNMGGHFIAFCKSPIDNRWYKYNDAMVEFVGNFYSDIVNFGVPYILFYESQNL
jgi:ubiquitin carboxyl-terminal hydrolase 2/21